MPRLSAHQTSVLLVLTFILFIVLIINNYEEKHLSSPGIRHQVTKVVTIQRLLTFLSDCASVPPVAEHNQTCRHPPLPSEPVCAGQSGLTGERLARPRKLVLMFLFGFEVDTLEIALREQQDLVDKIFLVESSATHRGTPKPLIWERQKFSRRFSFVNWSKLVHVVADDLISDKWKLYEWEAERDQTRTGVSRILNWAASSGSLTDDDLLISASVDEVMSREALHQLRWCRLAGDVVFGGLWMPMGNLKKALRVDVPSQESIHLYVQPTIYTWRTIVQQEQFGERLNCLPGRADGCQKKPMVKGGIHLTNSAFLPTSLIKEFSATEEGYYSASINWNYLVATSLEELNLEQDRLYNQSYRPLYNYRLDDIEKVTDVTAEVPLSLECNQERFPYWFGLSDPRNKILHEKLAGFKKSIGITGNKLCPFLFSLAYISLTNNTFGTVLTCDKNIDSDR